MSVTIPTESGARQDQLNQLACVRLFARQALPKGTQMKMTDQQHHWTNASTYVTAKSALAKQGIALPDLPSEGGSDLLAARSDLRRGMNLIRDQAIKSNNNGDSATAERLIDEVEAVAAFMERAQNLANVHDDARRLNSDAPDTGMKIMRNAADFRAHYRGEGEQVSTADFLRGVARLKTSDSVRNALSVGTDTAGGFSVPSRVMSEILAALAPASSLMQAGAGIVALDEGAKNFTTAVVDALPTAAWRLENGAVAESDPAFRGVVATPRSLAFYFKVSRELLADSPNMNSALLTAIGKAFAKEMDRAGLRGTGTAPEPRGILNTSGIQTVTNGANGTVLGGYANLFSAYQAILQANAPAPTAAIMSPRSLVKLGGLIDTTNQPLNVPAMLKDVALIPTSQIPNTLTVGSSTDCSEIYVGDFSIVNFMLRENISVQLADQVFATSGQLAFVCHARVDVAVMYPAALALVTGVR